MKKRESSALPEATRNIRFSEPELYYEEDNARILKNIRFSQPEPHYEEEHACTLLSSVTRKEDKQLLSAVTVQDKIQVLEALIKNANINVTNDELKTPLHIISELGNITIAYELLKVKNIQLNKLDVHGSTPLHLATYNNQMKMAHILLLYGANPNVICRHSETALHTAVGQENFKITKLLLQFGAKVNYPNCFGTTALQKAVELNNLRLIKLLFAFGAKCKRNDDSYDALSHLILAGNAIKHIKLFRLLLNHGVRVNTCNRINRLTTLHLAAMRGIVEFALILIQNGANSFVTDKSGRNSLSTALYFRNWSVAKVIFEAMEETDPITTHLEFSKARFSVRQSFVNIWTK